MNRYFLLVASVVIIAVATPLLRTAETVDVGSRLELFVDDFMVDRVAGRLKFMLHKPEPQEVVLVTDKPWEGNTCLEYSVFRDGDLYRMYYRGAHWNEAAQREGHREVTCYAESYDGVHWSRPELGLFEFEGSRANNIVWDGIGTHCFTVFKDANPNCKPEARYKAISRGWPLGEKGLYTFQSPDGIHWELMHSEPVITNGDFDSQNLAFWDPVRNLYVDYHRKSRDGKRDIMTATSKDFLHWSEPEFLQYPNSPKEHLYTNAILPYPRAPHIKLGFPTRFLPETEQVEPTLMASRDGRTFYRWNEALIPRTAPEDRDGNRSNYMTWGMVQLPGRTGEYSMYATEAYYTGPDSRVRRFTYRVDGFVSVRGSASGGEVTTRPMTFGGRRLVLNYVVFEGGSVRVELQDISGAPIEGFSLDECKPLRGDAIAEAVVWAGDADLAAHAGQAVRLRFRLESADLFAFQFCE